MVTLSPDVVTSPVAPTASELQQIACGDQGACSALLHRWEGAIRTIAWRYAARPADRDDLMQIGRLAVYQAALRFDESFEAPFCNYAKRAIRNEVLKESMRLARQRDLESPVDHPAELGERRHKEVGHRLAISDRIDDLVSKLAEPHRTIFQLLYLEGHLQRSAAKQMGISQPRVAQLNKAFLAQAREALAN